MDKADIQPKSSGKPGFKRAHIIIVGNEKGGCGKTTTTMHLIVALLRLGFSVGCIDLDSRQRSLSRYVENRRQTIAKEGTNMPMPRHAVINKSPFDSLEEAKKDERERFAQAFSTMYGHCDFVVIDTPGNDTYMSRLAHSFADTIITPINDSFVDLDVLASVDGRTLEIIKPSIYSEIVWEQKLQRAKRDGGSIDWIVMRNRLSNIDAKNKRFMAKVTTELSRRIGFRAAPGFSERVIFRELFLQGLTVLDVMDPSSNVKVSMSHIAARQEVRDLLKTLNIDAVNQRADKAQDEEEEKPSSATTGTTAEKAVHSGDATNKNASPKQTDSVAASAEEEKPTNQKTDQTITQLTSIERDDDVKKESELRTVKESESIVDSFSFDTAKQAGALEKTPANASS